MPNYVLCTYTPHPDMPQHSIATFKTINGTIISQGVIEPDESSEIKLDRHTILSIGCGFASGFADVDLAGVAADSFNHPKSVRIIMSALSGAGIGALNAASSLSASFSWDPGCWGVSKFVFSMGLASLASLAASILAVQFGLTLSDSIVGLIMNGLLALATFYATIGDTLYGIQHIFKYTFEYMCRTKYYDELSSWGINGLTATLFIARLTMIFIAYGACAITILGTGDEVYDFFHKVQNWTGFDDHTNYAVATVVNFSEYFSQVAWLVRLFSVMEDALIAFACGRRLNTKDKFCYVLCILGAIGFGYALLGTCDSNYKGRMASFFGDDDQQGLSVWRAAGALPALAAAIQGPLLKTTGIVFGKLFEAAGKVYSGLSRATKERWRNGFGLGATQPLLQNLSPNSPGVQEV